MMVTGVKKPGIVDSIELSFFGPCGHCLNLIYLASTGQSSKVYVNC